MGELINFRHNFNNQKSRKCMDACKNSILIMSINYQHEIYACIHQHFTQHIIKSASFFAKLQQFSYSGYFTSQSQSNKVFLLSTGRSPLSRE